MQRRRASSMEEARLSSYREAWKNYRSLRLAYWVLWAACLRRPFRILRTGFGLVVCTLVLSQMWQRISLLGDVQIQKLCALWAPSVGASKRPRVSGEHLFLCPSSGAFPIHDPASGVFSLRIPVRGLCAWVGSSVLAVDDNTAMARMESELSDQPASISRSAITRHTSRDKPPNP